jgi:PKD repeat protein
VRRAAFLAAALVLVPAANAAPPAVTAQESGLTVTLTADQPGHWDFGDGQSADGTTVTHTYAKPGAYTVTVTAADGESVQTSVTARILVLTRPAVVGYGERLTFRGHVIPALAGRVTLYRGRQALGSAVAHADGSFRITAQITLPGGYTAAAGALRSPPVPVVVRPLLQASFLGSTAVGGALQLRAQLHPAGTNRLRVLILRDGRAAMTRVFGGRAILRLDTSKPALLRIRVTTIPGLGYAGRTLQLTTLVAQPRLAVGATTTSVTRLTAALAGLHYVVPRTSAFDGRVLDAVYAFQKVQDLPRTGAVDRSFWAALSRPRVPRPRYGGGDHIEIDKVHQVLYVVRGGAVGAIVPVSTAGIAGRFTPVGRFAIYRKVTGFDPSPLGTLFDPMYFTGGYAIHGNPSVPPYPASHGCVRVPMWIAPILYETNDYGEPVYVY